MAKPSKRSANDSIPYLKGSTVGEFWAWAYSDILSNVSRGVYAEFLVGKALNALNDVRNDWDNFDITYRQIRVEVKSSAYIQTWEQKKESEIRFEINPKATGKRDADVYVFCLFMDKDIKTADVLDPRRWEFYVVRAELLPEGQKTIGLNPLKNLCEKHNIKCPLKYDEIQKTLDDIEP